MTSECPYIPLCTSYTPCCRVCQEEPGPYCGKWREFDTALQLKREKAARRAQQAKKLFCGYSDGIYTVCHIVPCYFDDHDG